MENSDKAGLIVGGLVIAVGIYGAVTAYVHLKPYEQTVSQLQGQQQRQEQTLASLDSEISRYWERIMSGGAAAYYLQAEQTNAQISAYCATTRIFPQTAVANDLGLCAKLDEKAAAASGLDNIKAQIEAVPHSSGYKFWDAVMLGSVGLTCVSTFFLGLHWLKKSDEKNAGRNFIRNIR